MNKPVWWVLLGIMAGFLGGGVIFLVARPPVGEPVLLLPAPTLPPLMGYVTGAVAAPGVYNLPAGSRVVDAVEAAGGVTDQANPDALNFAQVVTDGLRINVPEIITPDPVEVGEEDTSRSIELPTGLININTANQEKLESLPEIGPYLAGEIIAYREANGPFKTVDELTNVTGIGTAILETIRDLITVTDSP